MTPNTCFPSISQTRKRTLSTRLEFRAPNPVRRMTGSRLDWLRFLSFDLGAVTPDENTIRLFREKLTRAGALDALFAAFDRQLRTRGYLPMGGQIVDATLVAAPKQRSTAAEKDAIRAGKSAAEIWPDKPAKAAQKDTDARWTLKFAKGRPLLGGKPGIDIAIPSFGYKSSIAICRRYGFIRRGKVTDGARFDGRMLRDVVTNDNTASDVWADTAYRSQSNETWLKSIGRVSRVHRKKPRGKPMSDRARQCRQVHRACPRRARIRPTERSDEAVRSYHWHCARRGEDHARQPRLQHRPPDFSRTQGGHGIAASGESNFQEKHPDMPPSNRKRSARGGRYASTGASNTLMWVPRCPAGAAVKNARKSPAERKSDRPSRASLKEVV